MTIHASPLSGFRRIETVDDVYNIHTASVVLQVDTLTHPPTHPLFSSDNTQLLPQATGSKYCVLTKPTASTGHREEAPHSQFPIARPRVSYTHNNCLRNPNLQTRRHTVGVSTKTSYYTVYIRIHTCGSRKKRYIDKTDCFRSPLLAVFVLGIAVPSHPIPSHHLPATSTEPCRPRRV